LTKAGEGDIMKENKALSNAVIFLTVSVLTLFGAQMLLAEPIMLNYSIFFPESHSQCQAAMAWAEEINRQSNGRVKITVFPGGTLVSAPETYDGVVNGKADIGMSCFAYTEGRFPVMAAADLPLGYKNGLMASMVVNDYYAAVKPKELADVKVLYLHAHGPGLLHTVKPVKTLRDFNKMTIRATGLSAKIVNALGGISIKIADGDTLARYRMDDVRGFINWLKHVASVLSP
jgi:TRAP-type C4-dicarboxylate transport system substrate-binding protein